MPELSRFYGIVVYMRFALKEHNPPHIHVQYGDIVVSYDIQKLLVIGGKLPKTANKLVDEWVKLHQEELLKMWETQEYTKIAPLD